MDLEKNKHFFSCILEFECTNNTAEYEALIQGLKKAIQFKVKNLKVYGDFEIIVKQVQKYNPLFISTSKRLSKQSLGFANEFHCI